MKFREIEHFIYSTKQNQGIKCCSWKKRSRRRRGHLVYGYVDEKVLIECSRA
jgi:hypothetical protein